MLDNRLSCRSGALKKKNKNKQKMILWLMHNRWIQVRLILCPVLLMTKGTKMKQQLDTCIMKGANCEAAASGPISSFAKNDVRKKPNMT